VEEVLLPRLMRHRRLADALTARWARGSASPAGPT
jgi:hypothetical protein